MKIVMITNMSPASENIRGTSALPYHLMKDREKDIDIAIYSFNNNQLASEKIKEVERELNADIHVIPLPKWFLWIFKFHLLFIRLFLKYPLHNYIKLPKRYVDEIKNLHPDGIWIYGEELSRIARQFGGYRRLHTLPDCESLYYYRMMGQRFVFSHWKTYMKCVCMYPKFLDMERNFDKDASIHYHLVGEEDAKFLRNINPGIQSHFLRHPHYDVLEPKKLVKFSQPKIRLLLAGQYNLYMQQDADLLVQELCLHASELKNDYELTFLGRGWDGHAQCMEAAGYATQVIKFAPDYIKEICRHDIQVTPISIGTGTKGKVLDAMANGLLVIGSGYSLENIAVEDGVSCLKYENVHQVAQMLNNIKSDREKYQLMAERGRDCVLEFHSPKKASKDMFGMFHIEEE